MLVTGRPVPRHSSQFLIPSPSEPSRWAPNHASTVCRLKVPFPPLRNCVGETVSRGSDFSSQRFRSQRTQRTAPTLDFWWHGGRIRSWRGLQRAGWRHGAGRAERRVCATHRLRCDSGDVGSPNTRRDACTPRDCASAVSAATASAGMASSHSTERGTRDRMFIHTLNTTASTCAPTNTPPRSLCR